MVTFVILNKGTVLFHTPADDWPLFPSEFFRENPRARLYRRELRGEGWVAYSFDKAQRNPRRVRCTYPLPDALPAAVKTALLLNTI